MHLLITGAWREAERYIPEIRSLGHDVAFLPWEDQPLPCPADWVDGVICNALLYHHRIESFPNLRYIQLTSAGIDHRVPEDYIQDHQIRLHTARGVYSAPMAEHALASVLWFYRGMNTFRQNQQAHIWQKQLDLKELQGKTVLIIGCGDVGTACAMRFGAMGCSVIGIDRQPRLNEHIPEMWNPDGINTCVPLADIVILTLPLTEETQHLVNEETLGMMKNGALLINLSRGGIIDEEALWKHLNRLQGVALDVFEEEPLPKASSLWDQEKLLITPHNSFVGEGNGERLLQLIISNLKSGM